jgi:fungal nitric oxide reductase
MISQTIKSCDGIVVSNQSANRDEEAFQDTNSFNIHQERGQEESLGFGYGDHRCAAEWLARAELEIPLCEYSFVIALYFKVPRD